MWEHDDATEKFKFFFFITELSESNVSGMQQCFG